MNKKTLLSLVAFFVLTLAAVPSIATVRAEPKESQYFYLYIKGIPSTGSGYAWTSPDWKDANFPAPPPDGPAGMHMRNTDGFTLFNVTVKIGEGSDPLIIPKTFLTYSTVQYLNLNFINPRSELHIRETIKIFTDSAKTQLLGTLELHTWRANFAGELGVTGAFEGHGAEGLDGVKLKGDHITTATPLTFVREGVIVGWPLDVTVWPPP